MASNDVCLLSALSKATAEKAVKTMQESNPELLESLNITFNKEGDVEPRVIPALERYVSRYWAEHGKVTNTQEDGSILNDKEMKDFLEYLDKSTQVKVDEEDLEIYEAVLEGVLDTYDTEFEGGTKLPRIAYEEKEQEGEEENVSINDVLKATVQAVLDDVIAENGKKTSITADKIMRELFIIDDQAKVNGKVKHVVLTIKKPIGVRISPQERTLTKLAKLINRDLVKIKGHKGWFLEGRQIFTESVSDRTKDQDNASEVYPTIASFLGNKVDEVCRMFFNKKSNLWAKEEGTDNPLIIDGKAVLVSDEELGVLLDYLGNAFTLQGLKNLISDFAQLEENLRSEWGEDIVIISEDFKMVAQDDNKKGKWVIGSPDLLIVDGKGDIRVMDLKTSKVNNESKYKNPYAPENDSYKTGEQYTNQIYHYIEMLRSYGFSVNSTPYIVMCDTYYAEDFTDFGKGPSFYDLEEGAVVGERTKDSIAAFRLTKIGESKQVRMEGSDNETLADYAQAHNYSNEEGQPSKSLGSPVDVLPVGYSDEEKMKAEKDRAQAWGSHLYLEPRLHVDFESRKIAKVFGMRSLEDVKSTEGKNQEQLEKDQKVLEMLTFREQFNALDEEERAALEEEIGEIRVNRPIKGIIGLGPTHIEGNPKLITKKEIRFLSEKMMRNLWAMLNSMQEGRSIKDLMTDKKLNNGKDTLGKSHADLIEQFGIEKLLLVSFNNMFKSIYNKYADEKHKDYNPKKFKTEDDFEKARKEIEKINHLRKHIKQFNTAGIAVLLALEKTVVPVRKNKTEKEGESDVPDSGFQFSKSMLYLDTEDDPYFDSLVDDILEGRIEPEAWTVESNRKSVKLHLSQEIRQLFEFLEMTNSSGEAITDPWGWGQTMMMNPTKAIQAILDWCQNCETTDQMYEVLEGMAENPTNKWLNRIITKIRKDKNLEKKFVRNFRKDFTVYSTIDIKIEQGKVLLSNRIVNLKSSFEELSSRLNNAFMSGSLGMVEVKSGREVFHYQIMEPDKDGVNRLKKINGKYIVEYFLGNEGILAGIKKSIDGMYIRAQEELNKAQDKSSKIFSAKEKRRYIAFSVRQKLAAKNSEGVSVIDRITKVLMQLGVEAPQQAVLNFCLDKPGNRYQGSSAAALLGLISFVIKDLKNQDSKAAKGEKKAVPIPNGLKGLWAWRHYQHLLERLSTFIPESVEASVYEAGKGYFSFTNPSRLKHTIRQLSDASGTLQSGNAKDSDFSKFIYENYGRYAGWYKDADGNEWLNDLLDRLETSEKEREALSYREELAFIGTQYRELSPLAFQLSILANYYGTGHDGAVSERCRWFATQTMSNKPVNGYVRMLMYKGRLNDGVHDGIVDRVFMLTFKQEINRIVDVLHHFKYRNFSQDNMDITEKALKEKGWTDAEINGLKNRIENKEVTEDDIVKLAEIKSGAKFHFLWYLNKELKENKDLRERIVKRINHLLTPKKERGNFDISESYEVETDSKVREAIVRHVKEDIVEKELERMEEIGLFETVVIKEGEETKKILKYQEMFNGKLGTDEKTMKEELRNFIWQDIAANIHIIQITGGDLANYGNPDNYQKRIAQEHAPGIPLVHDEDFDDGYIRSVYVTDEKVMGETIHNASEYLRERAQTWPKGEESAEFEMLKNDILEALEEINTTDGQSITSITGIRKKLANQGEWTTAHDAAYDRISSGKFDLSDLLILMQPSKPFIVADMAKLSNSPTMLVRKVTTQMKNSEYLILLADALSRASGKRSKLTAIHDFLERTSKSSNGKQGIDTVHFKSVGKNGVTGVIDLDVFDKEFEKLLSKQENYGGILDKIITPYLKSINKENTTYQFTDNDYSELMSEYMMMHIRRYNENEDTPHMQSKDDYDKENEIKKEWEEGRYKNPPVLKSEELLYNSQYVDTVPISSYIIQQPVPEHDFDEGMKYGSQIRILGISDITPGTRFTVNRGTADEEELDDETLVNEYKELHAKNIREAAQELLEDLGLDELVYDDGNEIKIRDFDSITDDDKRDEAFFKLEFLLQKELMRDLHYSLDLKKACTLTYREDGHVKDFLIPLYEPSQSNRVQMLLNSIIKRIVNQQRITGSPVVQVTGFDSDLHIIFNDADGNPLPTYSEFEAEWTKKNGKPKGWKEAAAKEFREMLKGRQAGIAEFQVLVTCPNKTLEALITKEDGSLMTPKEIKSTMPDVWKQMSKMIGYRIPTEAKYSILPLRIVGFLPSKSGQGIMMPKEITALTGSDFDIDKLYIMLTAFAQSSLEDMVTRGEVRTTGKSTTANIADRILLHLGMAYKLDDDQLAIAGRIISNAAAILSGNTNITLTTGVRYVKTKKETSRTIIAPTGEVTLPNKGMTDALSLSNTAEKTEAVDMTEEEIARVNDIVLEPIRKWILQNTFRKYDKNDMRCGSSVMEKKARDNRIFDLQWSVLTNKDTALKILHSGNFNEEKRVGRITKILRDRVRDDEGNLWTWERLDDLYNKVRKKDGASAAIDALDALILSDRSYSITLPSTKIYFQRQNMQGSQLVGACANANVSHAFMSFQNLYLDLDKLDSAFYLFGRTLGSTGEKGGMTRVDPQRGFDGRLVSDVLASMLAAAVDTAKDTSLKEANIDTFTIGAATTMVRLGFSYEEVGQFLSQPVISELSDMYFRRKVDGYYDGEKAIREMAEILGVEDMDNIQDITSPSLTREEIIKNISSTDYKKEGHKDEKDFQIRVLKAFKILYMIAGNMQKLTFCTKFNSVSNAPGPFIADSMVMEDRVNEFIDNPESECFYEPTGGERDKDNKEITAAQQVISEDPILSAFYDCTIGRMGVATIAFRALFPHYYPGFQNIIDHFKVHYTRSGRISNTLYNSLLNDYMYYLLTYSNKDKGLNAVVPCENKDIEEIVKGMVETHSKVQELARKKVYKNELLSNEVGDASIYIRTADNFIKTNVLNFRSSKLDKDGRDKVTDDWDDLLLSDDPGLTPEENAFIQRYAVDLFFYNLMRNGFGFNPRTMMHLASTIMKLNAQFSDKHDYYVVGLRTLKQRDKLAVTTIEDADKFCRMYLRNHTNNTSLMPTFNDLDPTININKNDGTAVIIVSKEDKSKLYALTRQEDELCQLISIIERDSETGETKRVLYELVDYSEEDKMQFYYKKTAALGIPNQFIEYNATHEITESYFEDFRGEEEDSSLELASKDEQEDTGEIIYNSQEIRASKAIRDALKEVLKPSQRKELVQLGRRKAKGGETIAKMFEDALKEMFKERYEEEIKDKVSTILEEYC